MKINENWLSNKKKVLVISITLMFLIHINIERGDSSTIPIVDHNSLPTISFVTPTDQDGAYLNRTYTYVNVSISDAETPNNLTALLNWNNALVGWWRFNENTGTALIDHSGNDNNGTLNNFDWTSDSNWTMGRWDYGLEFDGSNDYVNCGDGSSLDITGDITIEAWIKLDDISGNKAIFSRGSISSHGYFLQVESEKLTFFTNQPGAFQITRAYANFLANTWYHVVLIRNGSSVKMYKNGVETSYHTQQSHINPFPSSYPSLIGARETGSIYPFNGIIDEVRVHSRVITLEEIKASYNAGVFRLYHNFTGLTESTNSFTAYVQDLDGNVNQTETRTITIDTLPPTLTVSSPLNNSVWSTGSVDFSVTLDGKVPKAWYSLDYNPDTVCYNCSGFQTTFNLNEGPHNITVSANNSLGQLSTITNYFFVNTSSCISGDTYGSWDITSILNCFNMETIRHGNTIIQNGGALNLNNVTILTHGDIRVNAGGSFNLYKSNLKLVSINNPREYYHVDIYGDSIINNSNIMSWNPNTNTTAPESDHYKGYIEFFNDAEVTVTNSNLSNLGGFGATYPSIPGLSLYNVDNPIIQNNTFINSYLTIKLKYVNGALLENNTIENGERAIWIRNSENIDVRDNNIITGDIGLMIWWSENITIEGNTIINITTNNDAYDSGIFSVGTDNVIVDNNSFNDIGSVGISLNCGSDNWIIKNNYIDMMEINSKYSNTIVDDFEDPVIGIGIVEIMKSWPQGAWSSPEGANRTNMTKLKSTNVTIENNTFGPNVQVLLYTEGTEDLTHDLNSTDYWLFSYFFPRLTDRNDLYISNNWSELSHVSRLTNRTTWFSTRNITDTFQKVYSSNNPVTSRAVFFNYIVKKGNITILPQGFKKYHPHVNGSVVPTDLPHDLYMYSPAYTPFGLNKLSTIYSNGTTYILLYDDFTEPDGYHTINMTVKPSSGSVNATVLNFNTSYKRWNISSDNVSVTVNHTIGDLPPNTEILIKKNGVDWNSYVSDSDGYISFMYDEGFSTITFEAESGSYIPPPDALSVAGTALAPFNVLQGETNLEMAQLTLTADNGSIEVTDIKVDLSGTGLDTDVAAAKLYDDIDDSGTLTPGDLQLGTTQMFLGGTLTFSGLLLLVSFGTPESLLIVYDISGTAITGNTVGCSIVNNTYITVLGPDIINPFTTIYSSNSTIQVVDTPPTADASVDQQVTQGTTVLFNGSGSSDDSGIISNYTWNFTYDGILYSLYGVSPNFKFEKISNYKVILTVWDSSNNSASDTMWVNVTSIDSDNDGLTDYDEENIYGTDPFNSDTDGDGISDGDEVVNSTDPLVPEPREKDFLEEFWWLLLIVIIIVIVVFLIGILAKRRKKEPEETLEKSSQNGSEEIPDNSFEEVITKSFMCPVCGSPVNIDATICPSCGAIFETDSEE